MKKGILIIAGIWAVINFVMFLFWGLGASAIANFIIMGVVWFGRKHWIRIFKL